MNLLVWICTWVCMLCKMYLYNSQVPKYSWLDCLATLLWKFWIWRYLDCIHSQTVVDFISWSMYVDDQLMQNIIHREITWDQQGLRCWESCWLGTRLCVGENHAPHLRIFSVATMDMYTFKYKNLAVWCNFSMSLNFCFKRHQIKVGENNLVKVH